MRFAERKGRTDIAMKVINNIRIEKTHSLVKSDTYYFKA